MRKSEVILFHISHLIKMLSGDCGHHDLQFKIVDRLLSRKEEIIEKENSLLNLLKVLKEEITVIQNKSSF